MLASLVVVYVEYIVPGAGSDSWLSGFWLREWLGRGSLLGLGSWGLS